MTNNMSKQVIVESGEWAGWRTWEPEPFEQIAGPFYAKGESDDVRCAFRATPRHLNGGGTVHGGCLMAFADFSLFAISGSIWSDHAGVTVNASCDFVGSATAGDLIEASGEIVRATRSLVFVRGMATVELKPILNFSGILKILLPR
jgi:acyl-coenzyme A thioesterase PaaI-like protein